MRFPVLLSTATLLVLAATTIRAQPAAHLKVGPPRHVSDSLDHLPYVEPVITVHPADPDHLIAAAIAVQDPHGDGFWDSWTVHVFTSEDGGAQWTLRTLPERDGRACIGDPWFAWWPDETLFLSCLTTMPDGPDDYFIKVRLFRSTDGGRTWSGPIAVPFAEDLSFDHPMIDVVTEGDRSTLYVFSMGNFSSVVLSRSRDGQHFEALPRFLPDSLNNSMGAGRALSEDRFVFSFFSMSQPMPAPLWAVRSEDAGQTFERVRITQQHVPVGFPMMAVDASHGTRHGRVYQVWVRTEAQMDVELAYSDDVGATWSEPAVVHRDTTRTVRAIPQVAVNDQGIVAVSWVDGRHHEGACWDVYATASLDGGQTFLPEARLTPETSCPRFEGNGAAARRWRWGGDYFGIVPAPDGRFHVAWSDNRTGVYQIWTTLLSIHDVE